jgi:hypothetical protein
MNKPLLDPSALFAWVQLLMLWFWTSDIVYRPYGQDFNSSIIAVPMLRD